MSSFPLTSFLIAILLTRSVTPTTYQVDVGRNGQFYVPNTTTTRNIGDKVQFNFYNNHSVVEADFSKPCKPLYNGFYSGFIPMPLDSPAAPQHFVVTINDRDPHYFYCAQEGMCWQGMVGVINPPASQPDDLAGWAVRAAETDMNAAPDILAPPNAPIGGVIKIESSAAPVSASVTSDASYSYDVSRFASRAFTTSTNASGVPTAIISDTTSISIATTSTSIATTSISAGSSGSGGTRITSTVAVTPTSSAVLTSIVSATSSALAPSAGTKKGAAGRVDAGDMGFAMLFLIVLLGIILRCE